MFPCLVVCTVCVCVHLRDSARFKWFCGWLAFACACAASIRFKLLSGQRYGLPFAYFSAFEIVFMIHLSILGLCVKLHACIHACRHCHHHICSVRCLYFLHFSASTFGRAHISLIENLFHCPRYKLQMPSLSPRLCSLVC